MSQTEVRALRRGLSVLSALAGANALSLADLHGETGLPKSTLLRLLATLEGEGYVCRRLYDGLWRRTLRDQPCAAATDEALVLDHSGPVLRDLCKEVSWPSDMAVYDGGAMKVIDTTRPLSSAAFAPYPAYGRLPVLSTGLGRVWLTAALDGSQAVDTGEIGAELHRYGPDRRLALVRSAREQTRRLGYGRRVVSQFRHLGRNVSGDIGVALPILAGDRVVGALNLMWYLEAMDEASFVRTCLPPLREAATAIGDGISRSIRPKRHLPERRAGPPKDPVWSASTGPKMRGAGH